MSLRIRRGTNSQRATRNFDLGELVYTTDTKQLYVGDGITAGGVNVLATSAGPGLEWDSAIQKFKIGSANLTTESITESENGGQYFTAERAVAALAENLITDPSLHTGISFSLSEGFIIAEVSGVSGLTTSNVSEGSNLYYTNERVQDTVANMFATGTHSGISFSYNDDASPTAGSLSVSVPFPTVQFYDALTYSLIDGQHTNISFVVNEDHTINTIVTTNSADVRSVVNSMISTGTHDGITYTYDAENFTLSSTVSVAGIEYHAAQLLVNGTHDTIAVEYDEANSQINLSIGDFTSLQTTTLVTDTIEPIGNADFIIKGNRYGSPGAQVSFEFLAAPWLAETTSILDQTGDFRKLEIRTYKDDVATPTAIGLGDVLGTLTFTGMINSSTDIQSHIGYQIDRLGTPTSTHRPTKFFVLAQPDTENDPMRILSFDSFGRLAVNQETANATVDINGVMRLVKQTLAPSTPVEGMIAVADRVTWDPASKGSGGSYPVYYDGSTWTALF